MVCTAARGALPKAGSLGRGELSHSLGALRHGVLCELAGEDKADSGLDLARGHSRLLVVARQLGGLGGNLLKNVSDEGVEDGDGPGGDSGVGMDLRARCSELISTVHSWTSTMRFESWCLSPKIPTQDHTPFQVDLCVQQKTL